MRFQLEADPEELPAKGAALLKSLAERLAPFAPEASLVLELLEKGSDDIDSEGPLDHPALREMTTRMTAIYQARVKRMLDDIALVIDQRDVLIRGEVAPEDRLEKRWVTPVGGVTPGGYKKVSDDRYEKPSHGHNLDDHIRAHLLHGNAGIPRIEMPQIVSVRVPEFIKELQADGIHVERSSRIPADLKATQSELDMDKVKALAANPANLEHLKKPIVISSDLHLLDGHHRWAALALMNAKERIETVEVDLPIKALLQRAKTFSGVEFKKTELDEDEDALLGLFKAAAGEQAGSHKYTRRTPYVDGKGRRRWRYYYSESSVAREARTGEEIRVGEKKFTISAIGEDGAIHYHTSDDSEPRTISASGWTDLMVQHHGQRYLKWAESRAESSIAAVLRHVPKALLADLHGETDHERLADLKVRVPEVYQKLKESFSRAGMSPHAAQRMLSYTLERQGWQPEARATLIGGVLEPGGGEVAKNYRQIAHGAENLAAGKVVGASHVKAAIELRRPAHPGGDYLQEVATLARNAEGELAKLSAALAKAQEDPTNAAVVAILAQSLASTSIAKLHMLAQAFPGLRDRAVEPVREIMAELAAAIPRREPRADGVPTNVFVAGEGGQPKALAAVYRLVEAHSLIPSHDPESFRTDERFPADVQERAYHRDPGEQDKVRRNAQRMSPEFVINTNPDAVNGPPITTPDGIVLGGNSRTMSMQLIYKHHPEKATELRAYLANNAHQFGLQPHDVEALESPVLVRVVNPQDRTKPSMQLLVRQMNESFTQAMDPRTMQVAMGRRLSDKTLASLADAMQDESLNEFLGSARAAPFVDNLFRNGIIDERNANQYTTKGTKKLNADGRTYVERILVGRIIEDADLLSETRPATISSVARAIPIMIQAEGFGAGYSLRKELRTALDALGDISHLAERGVIKMPDAKTTERDFDAVLENLRQLPGIGVDHPILSDPRSKTMLKVLVYQGGTNQIARVFREYSKLAAQYPEGQLQLMGSKLSPDQVFRHSVEAAISKEAKEEAETHATKTPPKEQGGLFGAAPEQQAGLFGKAGLFIGPRGGRWADSQHTVAWHAPEPAHQVGDKVEVKVHPVIGRGEYNLHVLEHKDGNVRLSVHPEGRGFWMPAVSVRHFKNDLEGKVEGPPSDNPHVNAVIDGSAQFLGKGDDGLAFRSGNSVVKVSTTVPYQPENPGHRTPEEAARMIVHQKEIADRLRELGVPGIQASEVVHHGDKAFQIKPYVEIPAKFTKEQLDEAQDSLRAMHAQGWALNDQVQIGIDPADGKVVQFDVGKAAPARPGTGIFEDADKKDDISQLRNLYREHGVDYAPRGGQIREEWDAAIDRDRLKSAAKSPLLARMLIAKINETKVNMDREIRRTEPDPELAAFALEDVQWDYDHAMTALSTEQGGLFGKAEEIEISEEEFSKAVSHKYIRREATGDPANPWRYFYNVAGKHVESAPVAVKHEPIVTSRIINDGRTAWKLEGATEETGRKLFGKKAVFDPQTHEWIADMTPLIESRLKVAGWTVDASPKGPAAPTTPEKPKGPAAPTTPEKPKAETPKPKVKAPPKAKVVKDPSEAIRAAYMAASQDRFGDRVRIHELRSATGLSRADFDRGLRALVESGGVHAFGFDDPQEKTEADEAGAFDLSGVKRHVVYFDKPE